MAAARNAVYWLVLLMIFAVALSLGLLAGNEYLGDDDEA